MLLFVVVYVVGGRRVSLVIVISYSTTVSSAKEGSQFMWMDVVPIPSAMRLLIPGHEGMYSMVKSSK